MANTGTAILGVIILTMIIGYVHYTSPFTTGVSILDNLFNAIDQFYTNLFGSTHVTPPPIINPDIIGNFTVQLTAEQNNTVGG